MGARRAVAVGMIVVMGLTSCSDDGDAASPQTTGSSSSTTSAPRPTPEGPVATFAGPLSGGRGPFLASSSVPDLAALGYVQEEFAASGTATAYAGAQPADGRWDLSPTTVADYTTRIAVRRPDDPARRSGTVLVEWLNVSGGVDALPEWTYLEDEIVREGHTWIGVSAQLAGVEGGTIRVSVPGAEEQGAGKGLVALDPERYGSLDHPGDAYSYDIYTQVGRALFGRAAVDPLDGLSPELVLAIGESQSAAALTTYANGIQPLVEVYDGFLIHSRPGTPLPLGAPDEAVDLAEGLLHGVPTTIRTDLAVPTIVVEAENDVVGVLGYHAARQDDTDRIRVWELAGTAHADKQQIGDREGMLGCPVPVNRGQMGFVVAAALHHLAAWAAGGPPPPVGPRLATTEEAGQPAYVRDEDGIVAGGVRTPAVDAPVDLLTGEAAPDSSLVCILFGQTIPLSLDRLVERYGTRRQYLAAYEAATDAAIGAGFVLEADRDAVIAQAQPDRIPS